MKNTQVKNKQLAIQWLSYAMFYFCRVNFGIIAPILMVVLGFTIMDIGMISTGLLGAYAIGQFINGQLNDKYAKKTKLVGMFGSSAINILMATTIAPLNMALLWILNGFFQSMGWSATVKMTANWFPEKERGKASGIIGTSYQIGNVLAWLVAGYLVAIGWRHAFIIPAILFAATGVMFAFKAKQAPEDTGLKTIEGYGDKQDEYLGIKTCLKATLTCWRVWAIAFSLLFLNIVRYGFLTWSPTMLYQLDPNISKAVLSSVMFPLAGSIGGLTIGYAEKKVKNIAGLAVVFLLMLAGMIFMYPTLTNSTAALACLAAMGFLTYAPHVLIVTRIPMVLGTRKASASVTGFIDGMGYIGATTTAMVTAMFIGIGGWGMGLTFWAFGAIASAITLLSMVKYKRKPTVYQ